jgi:malonyl-CoA O-methyltransferase
MSVVFELDKNQVRQSFARASNSYDGLASLQCSVGKELLTRSLDKAVKGIILDLGCGTGFVTGELLKLYPAEQVVALDIALPMLQVTRNKNLAIPQLGYICADAESLSFKDRSINMIVSNLALQWCRQLQTVCVGVNHVLKPGGQFLCSTFGPKTLKELKHAWAQVDQYTHVNSFYGEGQIRVFMEQAGFQDIRISSRQTISHYDHVLDLMKELKGLGAHNLNHGRNRSMTGKRKLHGMIRAYEGHSKQSLIPATFDVIFISARK